MVVVTMFDKDDMQIFARAQINEIQNLVPHDVKEPNGSRRMWRGVFWRVMLRASPLFWKMAPQCFMIREKNPEKSFEMFTKLVTSGIPGLVISREYPEKLKKKYPLAGIPMIWLTRIGLDNTINPDNLGKLVHTVEYFLEDRNASAVLLGGVEYLIVQNNFEDVLECLDELKTITCLNNSRLIIPIHSNVLSTDQVRALDRKWKVI